MKAVRRVIVASLLAGTAMATESGEEVILTPGIRMNLEARSQSDCTNHRF